MSSKFSSHIPAPQVFPSKANGYVGLNSRPQFTLKDTPANRAMYPEKTPNTTFNKPTLNREAYYADKWTKIFRMDVVDALGLLKKAGIKVDCIVTSPPFYGQRDYGIDGQLGLEPHPQQYIDQLVKVFDLCRDILRDTGSLWVNIGDTYWSGKGQHRSGESKQSARRFGARPQDARGDGKWTKPKQLLLMPHRFAIAMQESGWLVRNDNVWVKPNPIPDQVRDRCSVSHEYVFHFTPARWYYFDRPAIAIQSSTGKELPPPDTWQLPPARGNGKHRASFSEELVRIPILGSTPPWGIVLDPFVGAGTSLVFARKQGLRAIGIDLVEEYCEMSAEAVKETPVGPDTHDRQP